MNKLSHISLASLALNSGAFVDGPFGSNLKASEYVDEGIPVLRLQNIRPNRYDPDNLKFISEKKAESLQRHTYQAGDVVITKLGEPCGVACQIPENTQSGIIVADVVRFRGDPSRIDHRYLVHFLNSPDGRCQVSQLTKGTTRQRVNLSDFKKIQIPLPPLEKQRRIAAILDKADAVRRKRKEAIALTEELLRSAFLDMFGNLLSNIDENPRCHTKGWTKCKLGDQLTLQRGFDITQQQCQEGIYAVISSGGVSAYHSEYKALGPGVLLGRKGSVGRVHYVEENYWPHDTTLWVKDFKKNNPLFVYYFFKMFPIAHYEASTSNPTLNRNRLHPVDVLWPPHDLQNHFAAVSESVAKCKQIKERAVSESNNFFNSLLQRAFRGEL
jgi:type I restriction enzyme S subunit